MANDIKQKIVLEGEKEYNRALSEAKRNLKTLRSELKAETAELGANATAQQKNETRIKSLQKQIKEQEKVVKTYQDALKEVKTKYADNEEAIAKWEVKLNEARTSLAGMKNELENVGKGFKDIQGSAEMATVASKSVADTFGRLSDVGEAVSGSIETVFTGLLNAAKEAVTAIWGDIVDLAARSNNLVDLAGFWNTDVTTIQKYAGAVQEVSGSLEDLNSLVTKVNSGDSKKIAELTGVSKANYKDDWEYAMAVMDALNKMGKENTELRNNAAFEIFGGKQATKAFDLLNDWEKLLDHLDKYDPEKGGYGLNEGEIQKMSDLYDMVNGLKASWQSLRDMATVNLFGDLAISISGNAQAILDALLKYLNATSDAERSEALQEIETNITAMFDSAKKAIEDGIGKMDQLAEDLKKSDNPTAQALGNILSGLVDALKWLTEDNMNNVVKALEVLAAFWLTGKGLQMGTKIAEIVKDIATIKSFKLLSSGSSIASGAASAGSAAGTSFASAFTSAFATAAPVLASVLGITAAAVTPALIAQAKDEERIENKRQERLTAAEGIENTLDKDFLQQMADALGLKRDANGNLVKNFLGQNWIGGNEAEIEKLLMGMNDRSDLQKMQLHNLLNGSFTSQGNDTWTELQRYWGGEAMDMGRLTALLESIADAYTVNGPSADWWTKQGGNSGQTDGLTSADAKNITDAVGRMPTAVAKGVSGIKVYLDGASVGRLVAPYVSEQIGAMIM